VGRQGRFVAEGTVVLRHLIGNPRFGIESLLILENRLNGLAGLLSTVPSGVPVYVATRDALDKIAGFPMHRGVLAIGLRCPTLGLSHLLDGLGETATLVVGIGIANHDNIGAIFRNAAAFGADAVLVDRASCDPLYRKAIRVSVGAALTVPFCVFDDTDELVSTLAAYQFQQLALTPAGESDIRSVTRAARTAIYLGAEGPGLPGDLIGKLLGTRISMAKGFDSLNVAAASAIALHCLALN
jgi:tRNA G18 (ribose-2'-O)-methylase SpoU